MHNATQSNTTITTHCITATELLLSGTDDSSVTWRTSFKLQQCCHYFVFNPRIFHQNMEGLKGKIDEFVLTLVSEMPHLVCLTEHHLNYNEIDMAQIPNYKLAAKYCRTSLKRGGVCIYIYTKKFEIH
jgi:hypothetical protein